MFVGVATRLCVLLCCLLSTAHASRPVEAPRPDLGAEVAGRYIVVFYPSAGSAAQAAAALNSHVRAQLAAAGPVQAASVSHLEVVHTLGDPAGADIAPAPSSMAVAAAASRPRCALGIQGIVMQISHPAALAAVRAASSVQAVVPDRVVAAQQQQQQPNTSCVDPQRLSQGLVPAAVAKGFVWRTCNSAATELRWIGERCSPNMDQIRYTAVYAVYKNTGLVIRAAGEDCVLTANDTATPAWNRLRFGSCGTPPDFAPSLPTCLLQPSAAAAATDAAATALGDGSSSSSSSSNGSSCVTWSPQDGGVARFNATVTLSTALRCGARTVRSVTYFGTTCGPNKAFVAWYRAVGPGGCTLLWRQGQVKYNTDVFGSCGVPPGILPSNSQPLPTVVCPSAAAPEPPSLVPDSPSPSPSPEPSPTPGVAAEPSPSPAAVEASPSPAPDSPSPSPAPVEPSPSPPAAEVSPSPSPSAVQSPSPAPDSPGPSPAPLQPSPSPQPLPVVEVSPSPAPLVQQSPSPAPAVQQPPSPAPAVPSPTPSQPSPSPAPLTPSPSPSPAAQPSPSPAPPSPQPSPSPSPSPKPQEGINPRVALAANEQVPWGVRRIEAVTTSGVVSTDAAAAGRQPVVVAVMDSGIDGTHPDLNVVGGMSWISSTAARPTDGAANVDGFGHGTHIAGTVGARNNGAGVVGVSPGVPLYSLKVLNGDGQGMLSTVLSAMKWVATQGVQQGIRVVNVSLATFIDPKAPDYQVTQALMCSVFKEASDAGVLVVVAAGNYGADVAGYLPAGCPSVAAVTALDADGRSGAGFSNYVPVNAAPSELSRVIAAPGTSILSTISYAADASGYAVMSGTSMAAPHVTGVAANCVLSGACAAGSTGIEKLAVLQAAAQARYQQAGAAQQYGFMGDAYHTLSGQYFGLLAWSGAF